MKKNKIYNALFVAIGSLMLASPAIADTSETTEKSPLSDVTVLYNSAYNAEWEKYGCTRAGWSMLVENYSTTMSKERAKHERAANRTLNAIKTPNEMKIAGFEYLGCDLSSSLGALTDIANEIQDLLAAISAGDIKDVVNLRLEKAARSMLQQTLTKASQRACQAINKKISDKTQFITDNFSDAKQVFDYAKNFDKIIEEEANQALNKLGGSQP